MILIWMLIPLMGSSLCYRSNDVYLRMKFLRDYVRLRNYRRISIVNCSEENRLLNKEFAVISRDFNVYVRVFKITKPNLSSNIEECFIGDITGSVLHITDVYSQEELIYLKQILQNCREVNLEWLVYSSEEILKSVGQLPLDLNNKIVFAIPSADRDGISLFDYYRPTPEAVLQSHFIGTWAPRTEVSADVVDDVPCQLGTFTNERTMTSTDFYAPRWRRDMTGLLIRCVYIPLTNYVQVKRDSKGKLIFTGIMGELWQHLHKTLNFTYECRSSPNDIYGSFNEKTGSWNGAVNELLQNRSDIAVAFMDTVQSRLQAIDFSIPFTRRPKSIFYLKENGNDADSWKKYLKEFTPVVWAIAAMVLAAFCVALFTISKMDLNEIKISKSDSFIAVIAATCNMGSEFHFRSYAGRICCIALYLSAYLLYVHYNSFLISTLTLDTQVPPFTTLEGFLKSDYKFVTIKGFSILEALRVSPIPLHVRIWEDKIKSHVQDYPSTMEGLNKIMESGKYATIGSVEAIVEYPLECQINIFKVDLKLFQGWGYRRGFPFKNIFDHQIKLFQEGGLFSRNERFMNAKKKRKSEMACSEFIKSDRNIPVSSIYFVLQLLFLGLILSLVTLIMERLIFSRKKKMKLTHKKVIDRIE